MQHQEQKHIAVCIPSTDFFTADFSMCLAQMCKNTRHPISFVNTRSSYIPDNRNRAVKAVLDVNKTLLPENRVTHILFLDNDMIFPIDIIERLLAHDVSIVAGAYPLGVPPHVLCYSPLKDSIGDNVIEDGAIVLEEVAGLPTGSMLIDVHVFSQIPQPWFEQKYYFLEDVEPAHENSNALSPFLNEYFPDVTAVDFPVSISCDYWFCALCRQAGFSLWLDRKLTAELQHVKQKAYTLYDSKNWQDANPQEVGKRL